MGTAMNESSQKGKESMNSKQKAFPISSHCKPAGENLEKSRICLQSKNRKIFQTHTTASELKFFDVNYNYFIQFCCKSPNSLF